MKQDYLTILLEEIRDQNKAILEGQKDQASRADVHRIEQHLDVLENEMQAVKAAVQDVSRDLKQHTSLPAQVEHGYV
jgi:archaellum component FlaC